MDNKTIQRIKENPTYQKLVATRTSFGIKLSIIMLAIYYAFILLIAFKKSVLGTSLSGGVMTVGIPVGIGIIIIAFVLTGIYVVKANSEFDDMTTQIKNDVKEEA